MLCRLIKIELMRLDVGGARPGLWQMQFLTAAQGKEHGGLQSPNSNRMLYCLNTLFNLYYPPLAGRLETSRLERNLKHSIAPEGSWHVSPSGL